MGTVVDSTFAADENGAVASCTKGIDYKLRAGTPAPQRGCPSLPPTRGFILQTFGGEMKVSNVYYATDTICESNDMIGLRPDAPYESANYQGTIYMSKNGDMLLTGTEVHITQYIQESQVPGVSNFKFTS